MNEADNGRIRTYLQTELQQFVQQLIKNYSGHEDEILTLLQLETNCQCKQFADKVNSGLKTNFESLEDYRIVTLVSASNPLLKVGGLSNAALWSDDTDEVFNIEYQLNSYLFSLCVHFILVSDMPSDEEESD